MSIKPILFNTEMVRAILTEKKTQTRIVNKKAVDMKAYKVERQSANKWNFYIQYGGMVDVIYPIESPVSVGDILWVRETWGKLTECDVFPTYEPNEERFIYRADIGDPDHFQAKWHPSIHMPRDAARIFLRVKAVRVERLQDITEDDVCEEGAEPIISCHRKYCVYNQYGVQGEMCWNTDFACKDCPELSSYAELFGEEVWNETIKKSDMDNYGWSANPWVWVITFERCEKPEVWL